MQAMSHGLRRVPNLLPHKLGGWMSSGGAVKASLRSAHAPTPFTQQVAQYSKNVLTRFISHLTAPGLAPPEVLHAARSVRASGTRTIHSSLSLPARHALGRPLGAPILPRAPTVPRSVAHVGLGTARNFHAARPIFANLVDNVPVAGRAFWEADWQLRMREERKGMQKASKKEQVSRHGPSMKENKKVVITQSEAKEAKVTEELNRYFSEPIRAAVTTYLMVPLAPTPSSRIPLALAVDGEGRLPIAAAAILHGSHYDHSTRVQSLFSRLDTADVWNRGASCEPMGANGDCTVLAVKLEGWTENEVRGVIGEAGTGWCALEEVRNERLDDSLCTIPSASEDGLGRMDVLVDPANSLILPTLDFSSTFRDMTSSVSADQSPVLSRTTSSVWLSDSECGSSAVDLFAPSVDEPSDSDGQSEASSWSEFSRPPSSLDSVPSTRFAFSSAFSSRMDDPGSDWEPREMLF